MGRKSRLKGGCRQDCLPHIAIRFPGIMSDASRRITNPPQVANLPHMAARRKLGTEEIVAAREDLQYSSHLAALTSGSSDRRSFCTARNTLCLAAPG